MNKKLGRPGRIFSKEEELLVVADYVNFIDGIKLYQKYNSNWYMIKKVLIKHGVKIRTCGRKYKSINDEYFELINTPNKAYFLGLMYADGCVSGKTSLVAQIGLQESDKNILLKFKRELNYDKPLRLIRPGGNEKQFKTKNNSNLLVVANKKIVNSLISLGCIRRKSLILKFPTSEQVPPELINHFIRGYFDGDGGVWLGKDGQMTFSFTGTKDICQNISSVINTKLGIDQRKIQKTGKNVYSISYSGNFIAKMFANYIYQDCSDIYIERKREKFDSIILNFKNLYFSRYKNLYLKYFNL